MERRHGGGGVLARGDPAAGGGGLGREGSPPADAPGGRRSAGDGAGAGGDGGAVERAAGDRPGVARGSGVRPDLTCGGDGEGLYPHVAYRGRKIGQVVLAGSRATAAGRICPRAASRRVWSCGFRVWSRRCRWRSRATATTGRR